MKTLVAAVMLFAVTTMPAPQDPERAAAEQQVALEQLRRLAWISGTWVLEENGVTTEEHWRPLQGTTMLGSSHSYDARRTHFFEHLRLTAVRGKVTYVAMPGGAGGTAFVLSKLEDQAVEFENAAHDHPQRIRYEQTPAGITATIGQLDGSRQRAFVYRRR